MKVKRPLSSYMFFANERRTQIKSENHNLNFAQLTRKVADEWKSMSTDEKQPYTDLAIQSKQHYQTIVACKSIIEKHRKLLEAQFIDFPRTISEAFNDDEKGFFHFFYGTEPITSIEQMKQEFISLYKKIMTYHLRNCGAPTFTGKPFGCGLNGCHLILDDQYKFTDDEIEIIFKFWIRGTSSIKAYTPENLAQAYEQL